MSDSEVYEEGALILVRDQYQPLNPIPAVFEQYEPTTARARVRYRDSGHVAWIDGRDAGNLRTTASAART